MNIIKVSSILFALLSLSSFGQTAPTPDVHASRGAKIDAIVVAERAKRTPEARTGTGDTPPTYVAYDGGYVEAGDSIAGEKPPSSQVVASSLESAFQQAGYQLVPAGTTPSVVIVYNWGSLRPRTRRDISLSKIDPNLKARLSLVATMRTVHDLEQDILARRGSHGIASISVNRPAWRDALDYASGARYFIVVTAYDPDSLKNQDALPIWRVSLSAQDNTTALYKAIPALAESAGPYLGKNFDLPQSVYAALVVPPTGSNALEINAPTKADEGVAKPADEVTKMIIKREHDRVAGEYGPRSEEASW